MSAAAPEPLRVWIVGNHPACDVIIDNPGVSARHCLLAQYPAGYAVEDLGSERGTWIQGKRLAPRSPHWLQKNDEVRLGPSTLLNWPPESRGVRTPNKTTNPPETITIGRDPSGDIILDYPMISWNHAKLVRQPDGRLFLEDLGSTNGTAVDHAANRIARAEVRPEDSVFFGSFKIRVSRLLESGKLALGDALQERISFSGSQMVIGRDPACEYPLNYPMVSWHHAKLEKTSKGIEIEDLGSKNGTFVDGQRINRRITLKTGSEIGLGSFRFRLLDEAGNLGKRDYSGNVTIEAKQVVVEIHRGGTHRRLLDPVSMTVFPSELIALMGPAGAGKTTLLKALNGYTPPDEGQVLFNGEDLYANREQFRLQVGYVPQDDILHSQLTVREALYYTAKLRTDLRDHEIEARIEQVLRDLNIEDIGNRLIGSPERKVISGGQRKRVNIAMELLSDPSVLFLDEPTSGLSSYDAYQVMSLLRRLADTGKTIICTIHQPSIDIFKQFDSLLMVARDKGDNAGMLVYFGPAHPEAIEFFNPGVTSAQATPELLMTGLSQRAAKEWNQSYGGSRFRKEFVESRAGRIVSSGDQNKSGSRRDFGIGQMVTLGRRNLLLKVRDRMQTVILLAQAPLFAALVSIVFQNLQDSRFTDAAKWAEFSGKIASVHFLMVVAAVWFGCNNAARDIVGETAIFQRERMVNLRLPSYVFSKMAVLALICVFQCVTLLAIVYFFSNLSGPFGPMLLVLVTASLVGTALGLLISALSPTTEAAIAFLPVVLLPFILLAGGIKPLHEMPKTAQWIAAICPTRWAYEANLLEEAKHRKATFENELQRKVVECQNSVAQCQAQMNPAVARRQAQASTVAAPMENDVAANAFPKAEGRSSMSRSLQVLGIFLTVLLVLILGNLTVKASQ